MYFFCKNKGEPKYCWLYWDFWKYVFEIHTNKNDLNTFSYSHRVRIWVVRREYLSNFCKKKSQSFSFFCKNQWETENMSTLPTSRSTFHVHNSNDNQIVLLIFIHLISLACNLKRLVAHICTLCPQTCSIFYKYQWSQIFCLLYPHKKRLLVYTIQMVDT